MSKSNPSSPLPTGGPPAALMSAVRRLLGPLVRLLLAHQITFPVLTHLLKSVYLEEADRGFAIPDRPQTISRLSLLTGIHRKDVKRLQAESHSESLPPTNVSLGAQLVLRWTAEPAFHDAQGRPRPLPRLGGDRKEESFETLVASVTNDIRPRAILDEWLRLGIAQVDEDDCVHLAEGAFVPSHGFDEKAYFFGRNLHDHVAAAAHNLDGEASRMMERSVYYAKLRPESVQELQDLASQIGMETLQRVNKRARELQRADESNPSANERMNFGVYFYRAPIEVGAELQVQDQAETEANRNGSLGGAERGDADEV